MDERNIVAIGGGGVIGVGIGFGIVLLVVVVLAVLVVLVLLIVVGDVENNNKSMRGRIPWPGFLTANNGKVMEDLIFAQTDVGQHVPRSLSLSVCLSLSVSRSSQPHPPSSRPHIHQYETNWRSISVVADSPSSLQYRNSQVVVLLILFILHADNTLSRLLPLFLSLFSLTWN